MASIVVGFPPIRSRACRRERRKVTPTDIAALTTTQTGRCHRLS